MLTREAGEDALPSLLAWAVDYRPAGRARCAAQDPLPSGWWCAASVRAPDFSRGGVGHGGARPEAMGMSYELADARVEDMRARYGS